MPKKPLPRILSVKAGEDAETLHIEWAQNHLKTLVNVSSLLKKFKIFEPLRQSPELFQAVRVGEYGTDIVWSDELDMSAETLWRLAQEQSGATMTAAAFREWRAKHAYTLDDAAHALGISRRMVAYYDQGAKPIPRVVALATLAFEHNEAPFFLHTG